MNSASVSLALDERDPISVWASRSAEWACLVLDTEGMYCEIQLGHVHLQALRGQLPTVLAGLARWATDDAGCEKAEMAERQAIDTAARALSLAVTADEAGACDLAASLRVAAAEASAKATAVDDHVRAFEDAAAAADHAVEKLIYAMSRAGAALRGRRDDDRPAEQVGVGGDPGRVAHQRDEGRVHPARPGSGFVDRQSWSRR